MKQSTNYTKAFALVASYARSVLAGAITLYLAGARTPSELGWSLLAALAPVLIRFLNPNDREFGIVPTSAEVQDALAGGSVATNLTQVEKNAVEALATPTKK